MLYTSGHIFISDLGSNFVCSKIDEKFHRCFSTWSYIFFANTELNYCTYSIKNKKFGLWYISHWEKSGPLHCLKHLTHCPFIFTYCLFLLLSLLSPFILSSSILTFSILSYSILTFSIHSIFYYPYVLHSFYLLLSLLSPFILSSSILTFSIHSIFFYPYFLQSFYLLLLSLIFPHIFLLPSLIFS